MTVLSGWGHDLLVVDSVSRQDAFLEFAPAATAQLDIVVAVDPMATVLTSFLELFGALSDRLPVSLRLAAQSSGAHDGSVPMLGQLLGKSVTCPDFLNEALVPGTFDEQIEQLRATPLDIVENDLATAWGLGGAAARRWQLRPERCLSDCCEALVAYRRNVIDRFYPRLEQRLQRESARLEAGLAEYGPDAVVGLLHPRLRLENERLRLRRGHKTGAVRWHAGRLVLKPMMCAPATYHTNIGTADNPRVDVAFFAVAPPLLRLQSPGPDDSRRGLDLLIGQPKAEILRSVRRRPGTTTDLADELGLAPSTVSFHLKTLHEAGAVARTRRSGGVYYLISEPGRRLLDA